ncbi:UDP-galactopyranose mutase [Butyrivibrio sp. XPD2006]|uniref:UDP-galactopyranose mutase n=1 Tax=Butyrivibrio sp. XPD2006 TaxID=1280668 RepID=UPI000406043A|nr:UDP-galactopyranose mutase [Butyrivibrio sp. XPD2006]
MNKEYIVVGAGLAGGVIARNLAEAGNSVTIYEKRSHMAGNMYDFQMDGILVQKYGPHVFHTNDDNVYDFITHYCNPIPFKTKCEAVIDGISTPSPFNYKTIDQFFSKDDAIKLKKKLEKAYPGQKAVTVVEMLSAEDDDIKSYAEFLFEKDYKLYTAKQWEVDPSEIDPSVLKRVPILLSYRDTYFDDKYEFMPDRGFEFFYRELINHENIRLELSVDALQHIEFVEKHVLFDKRIVDVIYTGAIDELLSFKYGELPYRSLEFDFKRLECSSFQNTALVAYPQEVGFTRVTEYTKMPEQSANHTVVAYEIPRGFSATEANQTERYYPILTEDSMALYNKYHSCAQEYDNLILCGRLADFKYYNMDQVILRAMEISEEILNRKG